MRLLLLTARPELETNRRLAVAAEELGVDPLVVDAERLTAGAGKSPSLLFNGTELLEDPPDAVIARVGNWRPQSVLAGLEVLVRAGVATPNPPQAIRAGRDHWRTAHVLSAAGLPIPETLAGSDPESLAEAVDRRLGYPVVIKQRRSRMGVGVIRCDARDQLDAVLDTLWRLGEEVVAQRYLPTGGVSLRLLVVGDQVVAGARFSARCDEWRSNAALGGDVTAHPPQAPEAVLALRAARALGLGHCGVDVLPGEPTVVVEVNPTPGFRHLEEAAGVDVARALVAHATGLSGSAEVG